MGVNRAIQKAEQRIIFNELMKDKYSAANCFLPRKERRKLARLEAKIAQKALRNYITEKQKEMGGSGTAKATLIKANNLQIEEQSEVKEK